jgi:hypothetical protein
VESELKSGEDNLAATTNPSSAATVARRREEFIVSLIIFPFTLAVAGELELTGVFEFKFTAGGFTTGTRCSGASSSGLCGDMFMP